MVEEEFMLSDAVCAAEAPGVGGWNNSDFSVGGEHEEDKSRRDGTNW